MSSPTNSITDIDDSTLNKKRGRAQSVDPESTQSTDDVVTKNENPLSTEVSAPKKTKLEDENVNTIRKNMKDMSTQDKVLSTESQSTSASGSQIDEENDDMIHGQDTKDDEKQKNDAMIESQDVKQKDDDGDDILEEKRTTGEKVSDSHTDIIDEKKDVFSKFGGKNEDDDDWGEFAAGSDDEGDTETTSKDDNDKKDMEKQKYTFGASSGFGTKNWASVSPAFPVKTTKPTFGGFGTTTAFGGFKLNATSSSNTADRDTKNNGIDKPPVVSFGSFDKTTVSPLAALATAAKTTDALSSNSPSSLDSPDNEQKKKTGNGTDGKASKYEEDSTQPHTFGESAKVKVPGIQETEVKTGEEDEDTIYQVKGKLFILQDSAWKERGVGTFRINLREDEQSGKVQTRLVMRTESVFRVILNLLLFEGMKVFLMQEKFVRFAGFETEKKEDGTTETKLVSYALRLNNPAIAQETADYIRAHIPTSETDPSNA
ncbi:hypothetical protein BDF20DRAFT_912873 [Mycotypha africana]|uniref:uncharacterized protein n=1 Tax=Mycotypha africana TaxID=64632 RepID=UPI002300E4F3|nr:uncharacterized protein BDF20DRAFT_912873 [Mycotypha africana]KAI8979249.1 hypothetical protein BDF20DRAFT_912873 [Mycotypha africana]